LSISSVDAGGKKVSNRSAAQIASYISAITSLGSLVMCLLLLRQLNRHPTAVHGAKLLGDIAYKRWGLESLAILYALPYALLVWSMVSFLTAIIYTCLFSSSSATRFLVGAVLAITSGFVVLCIRMGWVNKSDRSHRQWPRDELVDSHRATPGSDVTQDVQVEEQRAPTGAFICSSTGDKKEGGKRHLNLPFMAFNRRPTRDSNVNDHEKEKVEV